MGITLQPAAVLPDQLRAMASRRIARFISRGVYPRVQLVRPACGFRSAQVHPFVCASAVRTFATSSGDGKATRLAQKAARKAHAWARKLPRTRLGPPIRGVHDNDATPKGQWKEFPAGQVRELACDMVGGNVTVVVDPTLTKGRCWVLNMGEARFRPQVSLDDGVLSVRHVHGLRSYVGQTEPVHTAVFLPRPLQGSVSVSAKMGEVWVFGAGLPTSDDVSGDGGVPEASPCCSEVKVDLALGDIQLHDVTAPSVSAMASVGDVTAVWDRQVPRLQESGVKLNLDVGMGDARVLARGDAPLTGFEWQGKPVSALTASFDTHEAGAASGAAAAGQADAGGAISATGKAKMMGDARLVRWGAHRLPAPADAE